MYERFYGLSRTPFAVTPDPAMLFMSRIHREALATIIYGVETRKGFIVCTGEVGTGKSTIIRAFFDQTRADAVKLIYIFTPQVTPFEMARFVCRELGLDDPPSIFAAVPCLQLKLLEVFESGKTVVLMIDEAQLLPPETLEFLRLLSNFETDTEKLIQIVLVGQPEVDTMLARPDMRQVNQRVALRARLGAFGVEESVDYIEHRLRVSGAGDIAQVMSPSAAWLIAEAAGGIPRRINILADNALIAGFGAAQRPLGSQLAGTAVREFLAKSGAARSAGAGRFGAGWRAARRLRSALAREKGEPAEWVSAVPPARPRSAAPVRAGGGRPAEPGGASGGDGWPVSRVAAGAPVSIAGTVIIAPVAQPMAQPVAQPMAHPVAQPVAPGADDRQRAGRQPATLPPRSAPPLAMPPVAPREVPAANGAAAQDGSTPLPPDARPGPEMRWPALTRVRTGLHRAPQRGQTALITFES
jgi:general secretion pathway protein A